MSSENVRIIQRLVDAWMSGDYETARENMDPHIRWYEPPQQPGQAAYEGLAGVDKSVRNWVGTWDDWHYEHLQLIDAGEKVLAVGRQSGRGKGSAVEVAADLFHLWTLRDGKAVEMRMFMDRREAFDAAGLTD